MNRKSPIGIKECKASVLLQFDVVIRHFTLLFIGGTFQKLISPLCAAFGKQRKKIETAINISLLFFLPQIPFINN